MREGFTLIELLAVLVILAIIALIAVPIVLNIIEDTKTKSYDISVDNIEQASEIYVVKTQLKNEELLMDQNIYDEIIKKVDGELPTTGLLYINKKGEIAFSLQYGAWCYTKSYEDKNYTKEKTKTCSGPFNYIKVATTVTGDTGSVQPFLEGPIQKEKVEKIITVPSNEVPEEYKSNSWDVSDQGNGKVMAWYIDEDSNGLYEVYIGQEGGVKANPDSNYLFSYLINVSEIDLTYLDTGHVKTMKSIFNNCKKIRTLDLSDFNTNQVIDMSFMFNNCNSLQNLDLTNLNTSKVTTMVQMFASCNSLKNLDISNFNTNNVENFGYMFYGCKNLLELDVSNFNTSKAKKIDLMFYQCESLKMLDLSDWNTSNVEDMSSLVSLCYNLEYINVSNWNTSQVTDMGQVFYSCSKLTTLDLRSWDTSNVTKMTYMFYNTTNLRSIYIGSKWKTASNTTYMFTGSLTQNVSEMCGPDSTHSYCTLN